MKKYMIFDAQGVLKTRMLEKLHNIPATAVLVDDDLWHRSIRETDGIWKIDAQGVISKHPFPPPTESDLISDALARRDHEMSLATLRMAPLQDAVDLEEVTLEEKALLIAWKRYRVALNRIEQQPGFPLVIEWPVSPISPPDA